MAIISQPDTVPTAGRARLSPITGADYDPAVDTNVFYATSAGLCFTLLGFWWIVVEFRHADLTRDRASRRFTFLVALHFIIPGLVSLASLVATGALWRIAFGLAGLGGLAAVITGIGIGTRPGPMRNLGRAAWLGLPLYALVTLIAFVPDLARTVVGLEPLQVEGLTLVVILALGVLLAWFLFNSAPDRGTRLRKRTGYFMSVVRVRDAVRVSRARGGATPTDLSVRPDSCVGSRRLSRSRWLPDDPH